MTVSKTGTNPTPFGFVGKSQYQTDTDSGLQLLGHRYYDPSIGRFLSQDPIQDGDNWYAYCDNNPLGYADPKGLQAAQQGRGDNKKLDPQQVKDLREKLQKIKDDGNKPSDRGERNQIENKLKSHEKGAGERKHGQSGDIKKPKVPKPVPPLPKLVSPQPIRSPGIDWGKVAIGALVVVAVVVVVVVVVTNPELAPAIGSAIVKAIPRVVPKLIPQLVP